MCGYDAHTLESVATQNAARQLVHFGAGEAGVILPRNKWKFAVGITWLLLAAMYFFDREQVYTSGFGRHAWAIWLLGAGAFLFSAYQKPPSPPAK